jgi:hypothetical protein
MSNPQDSLVPQVCPQDAARKQDLTILVKFLIASQLLQIAVGYLCEIEPLLTREVCPPPQEKHKEA